MTANDRTHLLLSMASTKQDDPIVAHVVGEAVPAMMEATYVETAAAGALPPLSADQGQALAYLTSRGVPQGLADVIWDSAQHCAIRYWAVDNSGSMGTWDGKSFVPKGAGFAKVKVSRWEELRETLRWHGETAAALGAHTEFRLLNQPRGAPKTVVVGGH